MSPVSATEGFSSGSGKSELPEVQVGPVREACGLARDLGTVSVSGQPPEEYPEELAVISKPLAEPVWKESQLKEGDPPGEPDRVGKSCELGVARGAGQIWVHEASFCVVISRRKLFQWG